MGASSRSPSPMTILPSKSMAFMASRIALTSAASAAFESPLPIHSYEAMAALCVAFRRPCSISLSILFILPEFYESGIIIPYHPHRIASRKPAVLVALKRFPEYRPADAKADYAGNLRAYLEPFGDFFPALAAAKRHDPCIPAARFRLRDKAAGIFRLVNAFKLPDIRLYCIILYHLHGPYHELRP